MVVRPVLILLDFWLSSAVYLFRCLTYEKKLKLVRHSYVSMRRCSQKVLWINVGTSNNNIRVIAWHYRQCVNAQLKLTVVPLFNHICIQWIVGKSVTNNYC